MHLKAIYFRKQKKCVDDIVAAGKFSRLNLCIIQEMKVSVCEDVLINHIIT